MNDLTPEEARALLSKSMVAHLGVISEGEPYVSPISFVVVDDAICLRTGAGRRVEAIRENPRVCVEASEYEVDSGHWQSAIAWGDAEILEDDDRTREIVMELMTKYRDALGSPLSGSPMPEPGLIVKIPIVELSGRTSGTFFSTRTRPGRL